MLPSTLQASHHGGGGTQIAKAAAKEEAINAWAERITLNTVVLNPESNGIVSINGLSINLLTMVHLRRFCVRFRISGYKNRKREETIQLIVRRMRSEVMERALYPEEESDISQGRANTELPLEDNVREDDQQECYSSNSTSDSDGVLAPGGGVPGVVLLEQETSSPTTRAMSRAAELLAKSKAKKRSKSSPPLSITQEGTYYRAINVYFDELHRADVSRLGEPPSMRDLDIRQFRNKDVYDKLLKTYLALSVAADHIHLIAFPDNPYLQAMGLLSGDVPFAAEFDVLTSEELKDVMEYINHWYRHAHRNSKKSGNHGNFEDFVGDKPFVYYYHLWLQEIPHLFSLAVPTLPDTVGRESIIVEPLIGMETPGPSRLLNVHSSRVGRRKNTQPGGASDSSATTAAMEEIGRAAGEKVNFMRTLASEKVQRNAIQKEKDLLDLLEMYDKSLKRKSEELSGYESDAAEAESVSVVIGMLKTKRERVLESLMSLP